jgi:hypothetical protein
MRDYIYYEDKRMNGELDHLADKLREMWFYNFFFHEKGRILNIHEKCKIKIRKYYECKFKFFKVKFRNNRFYLQVLHKLFFVAQKMYFFRLTQVSLRWKFEEAS